MKSKIFLTIFLIIAVGLNSKSQTYEYVPMSTNSATWNVIHGPIGSGLDSNYGIYYIYENKVYSTAMDTLINNEIWTKIVLITTTVKLYNNGDVESNSAPSEMIYQGAYLETDKIVRFCSPAGKIDTIYDFNLSVGDTAKFLRLDGNTVGLWFDTSFIVEQINMITVNNALRKHFVFKAMSNGIFQTLSEGWIEGIGSIHGVLFPANPRLLTTEMYEKEDLTCFWLNNNLIWKNGFYANCEMSKINEFVVDNQFAVYPNPAQNQIMISNSKYRIDNIEFFNITGQCVLSKRGCNDFQAQINIQSLSNGIYNIRIITQTGATVTKKFIKYNY